MKFSNYIRDLLFRYECVIIPEFGGFVTNTVGSKIDALKHTFYPPTKKLSFNPQLKNNDGLLANYISTVENCSFEEALSKITTEVKTWKKTLKKKTLVIENIGTLLINKEGKIIFSPLKTNNYLTSSFGLYPFSTPAIERVAYKQKTTPLHPKKKNRVHYLKYAASAAILLTIGTVGTIGWRSIQQKQIQALEVLQQEKLYDKIQKATFVIDNPLPEIKLNVVKKITKKYHLIAGAFAEGSNAERKLKQLKDKGFNAKIIGINKWGLTHVAFDSYETRDEAVKDLKEIRIKEAKDAWLLIK